MTFLFPLGELGNSFPSTKACAKAKFLHFSTLYIFLSLVDG